MDPQSAQSGHSTERSQLGQSAASDQDYIDSATRAIHNRKPVPEIDFSLHTMEDGTQVNTLDRVCKGISQ